jgi:hypothetical protein
MLLCRARRGGVAGNRSEVGETAGEVGETAGEVGEDAAEVGEHREGLGGEPPEGVRRVPVPSASFCGPVRGALEVGAARREVVGRMEMANSDPNALFFETNGAPGAMSTNMNAIPAWSPEGVLPPINPANATSPHRSPYVVSLLDYVMRFGATPDRREVLSGFLGYRSALHAAGLTRGFQWLDGSFVENVELIEKRSPNDTDVVTFFHLPPGTTQRQLAEQHPGVVDHGGLKKTFRVDAYLVHLGVEPERLARESAYWYSIWAHRRSEVWKGFVQVDLGPTEDALAQSLLDSLARPAGGTT